MKRSKKNLRKVIYKIVDKAGYFQDRATMDYHKTHIIEQMIDELLEAIK
jgi:hypothetical protein